MNRNRKTLGLALAAMIAGGPLLVLTACDSEGSKSKTTTTKTEKTPEGTKTTTETHEKTTETQKKP